MWGGYALFNAKLEGFDDKTNWLLDILTSGVLPNDGYDVESNQCPTAVLFDDYLKHALRTSPRKGRSI